MPRRFQQNIGLLILSAVLLWLASSKSNGVDGFLMLAKTRVKVFNYLEHHQDLILHCRSEDDDLQPHRIGYGEHFEWSFRVNFFGRTQYYCSFQWPGAALKWFDIYIGWRDDKLCDTCLWGIWEDRPCMLNTTDYLGHCFEYNRS
ncbi:S-protein homolog 29-like [Neltuma alba]|uniref:S-protein homolog 29-like n=1 Tax=Neltuma alba TaxID=207710 RepID=UPI0010A4E13A|nr:S-protein homolog 29-like [Prosopis alba]